MRDERNLCLGPQGSQDTAERGERAERKAITPETSIKYLCIPGTEENSSKQDKSRRETYTLLGRQILNTHPGL